MSEHTPLPWRIDHVRPWPNCPGIHDFKIKDKNGRDVARIGALPTWEEMEANAEYIVGCVNNHDALIDALQSARQFIENGIDLGYITMPDDDTPDEAHNTLPKILKALQEDEA